MKIKRTLPSVEEQSFDFNRISLNRSSNDYLDRSSDQYISISQFDHLHKMKKASTTFSKTLSQQSEQKILVKNKQKTAKINDSSKRTVTFANIDNENPKNSKNLNNKSKSRQRIPIFANSPIKKRNQEKPIISTLNIKQISNKLKQNRLNDEEKIISKISQLENVVSTIQSQLKDVRKSDKKPNLQYQENINLDSSIYKLQLEQAKRCERIAKQNQVLYRNLIKSIEKQNSARNSRKIDRVQNSNNKQEKNRITQSRKRSGPKITAFEDLQKYERQNAFKLLDESEGFLEITSPFYLQDNKGKVRLRR